MNTTSQRKVLSVSFFLLFAFAGFAQGAFECSEDALQNSGSIYRICMPVPAENYNNKLVIWAHGFQDATEAVQIPEDQLGFGDFYLPDIITGLGFGFATNSYSKTGLAIVQGSDDIVDLVDLYTGDVGSPPEKVYLIGASEGGIITTLLMESRPDLFDAGVAACGPVGDFPFQINYFGDARATFQYFFPFLIPGELFDPEDNLINNWENYYESTVKPVVFSPARRADLDQWVKVAKLPFDANDKYGSLETSVKDVLRYSVVNLKDAAETLGGFPFGNRHKWYHGSNNDFLLNLFVPRIDAEPAAIAEMKSSYNTTGDLAKPLVTLHTKYDQQVPYIHEFFYNLKTIQNQSLFTEHVNIPVDRFGHCNFTADEALLAFGLMLLYAGDLEVLGGVGSVLQGNELQAFEIRSEQFGLPYSKKGDNLAMIK